MVNILLWLKENTEVVQAVATIVLVIVTLFYVRLTSILAHAPFYAYIIPRSLYVDTNRNDPGWTINLYNTGPGVALNIKLLTIAAKDNIPDTSKPGYNLIIEDWYAAEGPFEISMNEEKPFLIKKLISTKRPFFIQWETQTGKIKKNAWKITVEPKDKILRLNWIEQYKFHIKWAYGSFKYFVKSIFR